MKMLQVRNRLHNNHWWPNGEATAAVSLCAISFYIYWTQSRRKEQCNGWNSPPSNS